MTYDQLLTLDAIIKAGSFKAAAERLHKSQPSISVAVKKLEEEFQIQIFSRAEYRPKLTETGKAFYEKARLALFHMQSLNSFGEELAMGIESNVHVGMDALCPGEKLYCPLKMFFDDYPATTLHLQMDVISGTLEKLEKGEIQIGIMPIHHHNLDLQQYDSFPIGEVTMMPVIHKNHLENIDLSIHELKKIPQLIIPSTGSDRSITYGVLEGGNHWKVTDMAMKQEMISSGLGWGGLPFHKIQNELESGELVMIDMEPLIKRTSTIHIVRNKLRPLGPVSTQLWEKLKEVKF
ncbi:hypothetical protein A9Q84_14965 [Halobacteriovorax marinus]|uniref:HTH lysR-type domain-containing protein n=1 Tax=Halobacteriovorax marinus TaxID=97084 RepID=A0A1Y5F561_9BACT|nr:hypothetical protein A9Q84_14965 [Halobacteriovorax marinus]